MRIRQLSDGSFVDQETGEVLNEERYVFLAVPARQKVKEDWFMAFQDALEEIAKDRDLWGRPRAVLDFLMARLSFENYIAVEQKEICDKLNLLKPHVSAAVKVLVEKGIIEKGPKIGRTYSYKLNPLYGWKGRVKNLQDERKKRMKLLEGGKGQKDTSGS